MNKLILKFFFLFICFTGFANVYGQSDSQRQKDSIRNTFAHLEGTEKLKSYHQLSFILFEETIDRESFDILLSFYKEFDEEAKKQKNMKVQGTIMLNTLGAMRNIQMHDELIAKAPEYLKFLKENKEWDSYFAINRMLLIMYIETGKTDKALSAAEQLYQEAKELQNTRGMADACYIIATGYNSVGRLGEMEEYFRKAIKLYNGNVDWLAEQEQAHYGLCMSLIFQKRFDEAFKEAKALESVIQQWVNYSNFEPLDVWGNLWYIYTDLYIATGDFSKAELYCNKLEKMSENISGEIYRFKSIILMNQKKYEEALAMNDKDMELSFSCAEENKTREVRMMILAKMGRVEEVIELHGVVIDVNDSIRDMQFNAQLDEIRTQYEVDKHIAEKERNRYYFLFALGGCVLLLIALGVWIVLNRKITRKNRVLALQIKELIVFQETQDNELLAKTTFVSEEEATEVIEDELYSQSRMDKLCIVIRDLLLKDKIYRNSEITRDLVIETIGTNRRTFSEAFELCFKMQFKDYINLLRLKDAVLLLEQSDLSIDEISYTAGFGTVRTFQRQFSAKYDMTPKEYRSVVSKG